jgi:hypothetical protein
MYTGVHTSFSPPSLTNTKLHNTGEMEMTLNNTDVNATQKEKIVENIFSKCILCDLAYLTGLGIHLLLIQIYSWKDIRPTDIILQIVSFCFFLNIHQIQICHTKVTEFNESCIKHQSF